MKKFQTLWVILFIAVVFFFVKCGISSGKPAVTADQKTSHKTRTFPDFGAMIPVDTFLKKYPGNKIFKLSDNFPQVMPGEDKIPAFFKLPFDDKSKWMDWLL